MSTFFILLTVIIVVVGIAVGIGLIMNDSEEVGVPIIFYSLFLMAFSLVHSSTIKTNEENHNDNLRIQNLSQDVYYCEKYFNHIPNCESVFIEAIKSNDKELRYRAEKLITLHRKPEEDVKTKNCIKINSNCTICEGETWIDSKNILNPDEKTRLTIISIDEIKQNVTYELINKYKVKYTFVVENVDERFCKIFTEISEDSF